MQFHPSLESKSLQNEFLLANLVRSPLHVVRSFTRILLGRLCTNRGDIAVRPDKNSRSGSGEDLCSMRASHLVKQVVSIGKLQVWHAITWVQPPQRRTRGQAACTVMKGELIRCLSTPQ